MLRKIELLSLWTQNTTSKKPVGNYLTKEITKNKPKMQHCHNRLVNQTIERFKNENLLPKKLQMV